MGPGDAVCPRKSDFARVVFPNRPPPRRSFRDGPCDVGAKRFLKTKKVAAPDAGGGIERPEFSAFRFTVHWDYEHAYAA